MKKIILPLLFAFAGLAACTETFVSPDPDAVGLEYFPIQKGEVRVYDVTDVKYMNNTGVTTRFQLMERVDTSFVDQTNTVTYKIIRSVKPENSSLWQEDSVFVVTRTDNYVSVTKDNTKRVKMIFPVKAGKNWSADVFNANTVNYDDGKEKYTYQDMGSAVTVGGITYDNSVTVVQGRPTNNLVQFDDRKEVFAKNIGMVYRQFNKITYCNDSESITCPFGQEYKLNGHERTEVLVSYEKN